MKVLVTGGAGFIGSAVIRQLIAHSDFDVLNVDKLTYAGNLASLSDTSHSPRYSFAHVDICDRKAIDAVFTDFRPAAVIHLAAESHVDRSIDAPDAFVQTNLIGTYNLLQAARRHHDRTRRHSSFRFLQVSTDEVFGDLGDGGALFDEETAYAPSSPYSATKAGVGSSRESLGTHLRSADIDHQLLEQLRPLPVSRKAHPAHDFECTRRQAAARIRRRRPDQGLAVRRRPCTGPADGARERPAGRNVRHRRTQRAEERRRGARHLSRTREGSPEGRLRRIAARS